MDALPGKEEDPRLDPDYAAYYHLHSRLDPRLPPPLYAPGQSWQLWAPPGLSSASKSNGPPGLNGGLNGFQDILRPPSRGLGVDKPRGFSLEEETEEKDVIHSHLYMYLIWLYRVLQMLLLPILIQM